MRKVISVVAIAAGFTFMMPQSADAATAIRSNALKVANTQKGARYVPGAEGGYSRGYDCSGLTYYSYKKAGKTLPRTAQSQYNSSTHISPSNRKVGDLVFIGTSSRSIYHVGIYTGWKYGKGWMVNANSGNYRGHKVVEAPISEYTAGSPKAYYGRIG
jgi:cell wall-associated NlpC family hydrolase